MPFTPVGNISDVITIAKLIKDLIKALDKSVGSSVEYQEAIRKLWALDRVLRQVKSLFTDTIQEAEMQALSMLVLRIVDQCGATVDAFSMKIERFDRSLREGGSGRLIRDVPKKLQWQFCRSDALVKFGAEVDLYCSILSVLISDANVRVLKLNDEKLHTRLKDSEARAKTTQDEHRLLLDDLKTQIKENNTQIHRGNALTSRLISSLRLDWTWNLGAEIKRTMRGILLIVFATYKVILDIQGRLPSRLERCLYQEPFILEDSHGRTKPIYLDCITSWKAFDAWLEVQFDGLSGYSRIQTKAYVLHDSAANKDIARSRAWEISFSPGQRIVMCMLFEESTKSSLCPNPDCCYDMLGADDVELQCDICGLWYRRKAKIEHLDIKARQCQEGPNFKKHAIPNEDQDDDSVASFKRVRMLTTSFIIHYGDAKLFDFPLTRHRPTPEEIESQSFDRISWVSQIPWWPPTPPPSPTLRSTDRNHHYRNQRRFSPPRTTTSPFEETRDTTRWVVRPNTMWAKRQEKCFPCA